MLSLNCESIKRQWIFRKLNIWKERKMIYFKFYLYIIFLIKHNNNNNGIYKTIINHDRCTFPRLHKVRLKAGILISILWAITSDELYHYVINAHVKQDHIFQYWLDVWKIFHLTTKWFSILRFKCLVRK